LQSILELIAYMLYRVEMECLTNCTFLPYYNHNIITNIAFFANDKEHNNDKLSLNYANINKFRSIKIHMIPCSIVRSR